MSADIVLFLSNEIALNGLAIFVVASCVALLCRRCRAAVRHAIWSLAFAGTLVSPVVSTFLPAVSIPVPIGSPQEAQAAEPPLLSLSDSTRQEISVSHGIVERQAQASQSAGAGLRGSDGEAGSMAELLLSVLAFAWTTVVGLFLLKLGADVWRMASWTRRAVTIDQPDWTALLKSLAAEIRLSKRIRLVASSDVPVPVTWGVRRPVILLPMEAVEWGDERRRVALLHELNHIRRGDYAWNILGYLSRSMHWFNPLAWYAYHRLALERERATDDCVLRHGAESHTYAAYLLERVQSLFDVGPVPRTPSAMGSSSNIRSRLQSILDDRICRAPLSRLITVFMLASATAVVGTVAVANPTVIASDWRAAASTADAIAELASDDTTAPKRAARVLGEREETKAVPDSSKTLENEDPELRAMAAWVLGEIKELASTSDSETVVGSKKIVTDTRQVAAFDVIDLRISGEVEVTIGQPTPLIIKGDDNILPLIMTVVKDGCLVITAEGRFRPSRRIEVRITVADLDAAEVSGSGDMGVSGLDNKDFWGGASGSGNLKLAGRTERLVAAVTGSGDILAFDLKARTVAASVKGTGNVKVAASEALSARIRGPGDIEYVGEPVVHMVTSGSGKVRKSK